MKFIPQQSYYVSSSSRDPFFSLTLNAVELSLFCDDGIVEEVFSSSESDEALSNDFEISEDTWLALQVEQHDNDSGSRVRDISAPLAEAGISILFLSTYISDFLLIKEHRLELVLDILKRENFYSSEAEQEGSAGIRSYSPYQSHAMSPSRSHESTPSTSSVSSAVQSLRHFERSLPGGTISIDDERSVSLSAPRRSSIVRTTSGSPATSPLRPSDKEKNHYISSALSSSRPVSFSLQGSASQTANLQTNEEPNVTGAVSAEMSPASSHGGAELAGGTSNQSQPRSWEKMETSILSEQSTASLFDKISLLPDELVCVGLDMQSESVWRPKLIAALFYPKDLLPRKTVSRSDSPSTGLDEVDTERSSRSTPNIGALRMSGADTDQQGIFSTTPTPARPMTSDKGRAGIHRSVSATSEASMSKPHLKTTEEADHPAPFVSLTLTVEGGSLIADIRVLRALFEDQDESCVYATGQGGLLAKWSGEDDDYADSNHTALGDARERSSSRGRSTSRSRRMGHSDTDRIQEQHYSSEESSDEDEDSNIQSRKLLKCLQLDLSSFGLEKAGLVHQFAGLLTKERIDLLYSATFRTANILVAKRKIRKAQYALESAS